VCITTIIHNNFLPQRIKKKMVFEAEDLIKQAIERYGDNIAVACSFGKDSMVVLHLALKYKPDIKVMFHNTGVEFSETIKYKEMIVKKWNLNLIETKPYKDMDFWKCVDKYGIPEFRSGKSKYHSPRCCYYLKEKPAMEIIKKEGIKAIFTGIMKEESRQRAIKLTMYDNMNKTFEDISFCGQRYFAVGWNVWKYHPLANWKEKEIWSYIKEHKIPINQVYLKWNKLYKRCGCLPCTAYLDWERKLSKSHKKLYLKLKKIQHPTQKGMGDFCTKPKEVLNQITTIHNDSEKNHNV